MSMTIRTIIPLLFFSALSLQADPECAEPMQLHDQVLTICRSVPELRELTKK